MAYLTTTPTFDSGSWTTEHAADIELVFDQVIDVNKKACPTLQILWQTARTFELGPEGKVSWNFLHDMYDVHVGKANQVFTLEDLDMISRMEYETVRWYVAAPTNEQEMVRYQRSNRSLINLLDQKVQAMHRGLTEVVNWALFSNWNETISANTIDIESDMSNSPLPPDVSFRSISSHTDRIYSIPMVIRGNHTGHTFGNVSSANSFWQSEETTGNTPTYSSSGDNIDVVTDGKSFTDPTVEMGVSDITDHLSAVQIGAGYKLYAACPATLYGVLRDYLLAERQRTPDEMLADLGINAHFTYEEFNTTFYVEPMMTWLWPNSIFFYDTECMFLCFDPAFMPKAYAWERIPGSNMYATSMEYEGNVVCIDRRGVSAMHGYNAG